MSAAKDHRKLHADNIRNPTYYVVRAGYAVARKDFYEGRDKAKKLAVDFTDENFVRGFNLTPGEYYRLRENIHLDLLHKGLYKKDFKERLTRWDLYKILSRKLLNYTTLTSKSGYNQILYY